MPEDTVIIEEESLDVGTPIDIHTEQTTTAEPELPENVPSAEPAGTASAESRAVPEPAETEPPRPEPPKTEPPRFEYSRTEVPKADPQEMPIEKAPRRRFFRREDVEFSRDKWILTHINSEDLLEYLKLEQERSEQLRIAKDIRGKRLMSAFRLAVSLAAIVAVVYLLRDVPTILVNILYICGIIAALWLWKNPNDPGKK